MLTANGILGVSENTSLADLKMAFIKAASQIHPCDLQKYQKLALEYQALSDQSGGGSNRGFRRSWKMKGNDLVIPLLVPLEVLYKGATLQRPFPRTVTCSTCKGKGSKSGGSMKCSGCQGSGEVPRILNPGPPVVQVPFACNECKGTGEAILATINDEDRCEQCKGEKVLKLNKVLKIRIKKGMQNGQMIELPRDIFVKRGERGVLFMIKQIVHPKFIRKGDDLFVEHTLSLEEAAYGYEFELTHLDNRRVIIKSVPGALTRPGDVKVVKDEGMPMYQRPSMRGKLHIRFTVRVSVLPPRPSPQQTDMEEVETATSLSPRGGV